jgi:bacillithiol system protein YtxJ
MSFLRNIFSNSSSKSEENKNIVSNELNSLQQLDVIDELSFSKPVVLFKHSTRCIISKTALREFERNYNFPHEKMEWFLLDLLNYREISNKIAERYGVFHQSPQIIVLQNGKAVFDASHENISASDLEEFIK